MKFPIKVKSDLLFPYIDHFSQSYDDFKEFLFDFGQLLCDIITKNPLFVLMIDVNARPPTWSKNYQTTVDHSLSPMA